ncbi:MAG: hypothetical protein M3Q81_03920 [bacterium]|nr:hypothetical protein [bacterium]
MKLSTITGADGGVCLVRLDDLTAIADGFGLAISDPLNQEVLADVVKLLIGVLSSHTTGVIPDRKLGLLQLPHKAPSAGVVFSLQEAGSADPLSLPCFIEEWGVEQIANNYGVGMLELYYQPSEVLSLQKKQVVAEVADYCKYEGIDLILNLQLALSTTSDEAKKLYSETVLESVTELQSQVDLFILPYLDDPLMLATITAELDTPWIAHLPATEYEVVKDQLRVVLDSGAVGAVFGEALWKDIYQLKREDQGIDTAAVTQFLRTQGRDRILELRRIISEAAPVKA